MERSGSDSCPETVPSLKHPRQRWQQQECLLNGGSKNIHFLQDFSRGHRRHLVTWCARLELQGRRSLVVAVCVVLVSQDRAQLLDLGRRSGCASASRRSSPQLCSSAISTAPALVACSAAETFLKHWLHHAADLARHAPIQRYCWRFQRPRKSCSMPEPP